MLQTPLTRFQRILQAAEMGHLIDADIVDERDLPPPSSHQVRMERIRLRFQSFAEARRLGLITSITGDEHYTIRLGVIKKVFYRRAR